jgi:hypothetical protein
MKKEERGEALAISKRIIAALISFSIEAGDDGANLRSAVGKYMANFYELINTNTVGAELYNCFELARVAGATLDSLDNVRVAMFLETPIYPLGFALVNASIMFSFVEQSQLISVMSFDSREQVDVLLDKMGAIIEQIKLNEADEFVASDYQNFVMLAALLIQHLSSTERQLPRVVRYQFPISFPSLTLAQRIYTDASRSDELVAENETVHPAFMQRDIIALSS